MLSGDFNLNGIRLAHHGRTLIVAHSAAGALYTVDPRSGASAAAIAGISVPNVDGIELSGRKLWAVQNASNQISRIRLKKDLDRRRRREGDHQRSLPRRRRQRHVSATVLAVVNAKFDTGFPPTADQYEVVLVRA